MIGLQKTRTGNMACGVGDRLVGLRILRLPLIVHEVGLKVWTIRRALLVATRPATCEGPGPGAKMFWRLLGE